MPPRDTGRWTNGAPPRCSSPSEADEAPASPIRKQNTMTDQPTQIGGGRNLFGDFAPKLAELTDDVLFADVWNRPELSARDRSLITVAVLTAGATRASSASTWAGPSRTASPRTSSSRPSPMSPCTPAGPT